MTHITTRKPIPVKGWVESRLDRFLMRAVMEPSPWWLAILRWVVSKFAALTLYFGRTFPYFYRPWHRLAQLVRYLLDRRRHETVKTIFLRRLFSLRRPDDGQFRVSYAVCNWIAIWILMGFSLDIIEGFYAYGTYPFGTYADVVVTQAYPQRETYAAQGNANTYAIHGNITRDGEVHEVYLTLGPNIWFWELTPEFLFGQIPVNGRCTFYTYGWLIRIPARLRMFHAGALYVLNPWIVGIKDHCAAPLNVPPPK